MWSDRYYYLNIYYDTKLSVHCDTDTLVNFLKTFPELQQTGDFTFSNSADFSIFLNISILFASHLNSWNSEDTNKHKANLIVIVCAKDNLQNFEKLKSLFIRIASFVNWQLVDELTDEEIEDYVIWTPDEKK